MGRISQVVDPLQWSFSGTPVAASFPSNDASNLCRVRIDGGQSGVASAVSLGTDVTIDRLEIDTDDSLTLEDAVSLTLAFGSNRPGSGEIFNDGRLNLDGASSLTQLLFESDLTLSGSGTLALSDSTQNRVAATGSYATLSDR